MEVEETREGKGWHAMSMCRRQDRGEPRPSAVCMTVQAETSHALGQAPASRGLVPNADRRVGEGVCVWVRGQGHGNEVDWWSLGILIHEMLVGLPPFYQENTRRAYEMLLTMPIAFPQHVSPHAQAIIRALLNVDSSKRLGVHA